MSPERRDGGRGERGDIRPHMEVSQWLEALDLKQYRQIFDKFGGVEDLLNFSEAHIKDLGVKNSAHRARIVSSLVVLKKKYNKCEGKRPENKSQRHSVAVEGGRLTHQNGGVDPKKFKAAQASPRVHKKNQNKKNSINSFA